MVVKPNTPGGSVSPSKSGPESVYYYLAVQYSWSIHPLRDQGTRADEGGGPSQGLGGFFIEVGLKSRNNGLSGRQGWCPRPAIAGAFTVCA